MPRMTKSNARQMLTATLKRFKDVTGESVGVVFSWKGNLSVLGSDSYKSYVNANKAPIWRKLALSSDKEGTKPAHDVELLKMLEGDITKYNVLTLRRLVSWITQKSVGKSRNYWGNTELRPSWWLEDIPFCDIYKSKYKQTVLQRLLLSYQSSRNINQLEEPTPMMIEAQTLDSVTSYSPSVDIIENEMSFPSQEPIDQMPSSLQLNENEVLVHKYAQSDVDTSSEQFFPLMTDILPLQPDITSVGHEHISLAELSGAKPIYPLATVETVPPPILSEEVRDSCLAELADPNIFLTDVTINAFCVILRNIYPSVLGLQDTILSQKLQFVKAPLGSVQIHYDNQLHWVCSRIDDKGQVYLYDSLYTDPTSEALDTQLALVYRKEEGNLNVTVAPIQQQRGVANCGLFAIAVCTALVMGENPTSLRWRQDKMRNHLSECFRTETITPFPTITNQRLKAKAKTNLQAQFTIELYCVCRLPSYAFSFMIECPKCKRWYHKDCVGLPSTSAKVTSFKCAVCKSDSSTRHP